MKIYIMRHGEAQMFAPSDEARELTPKGRLESRVVMQKVEYKVFDLVLVSPYIRAQQTWQEVASLVEAKKVETSDEITPYGDSESVAEYIKAVAEVSNIESVLLVSHLPLVGYLTAEFATGMQAPMFATSSIACVDYSLETQSGELLWHLQAD